VQSAAGYIWATQVNVFTHKTIRIDPKSNTVVELSRPWSEVPDFLVDDHSIWYTDGMAVQRVDIASNKVTATIEGAGIPFALGDGAVWTYNHETHVVSGIDAGTSRIRTQILTKGRPYLSGSFAFGAGSIWQYSFAGEVSWWEAHGRDLSNADHVLPTVVRRIDPYTKKIIAEIPIGLTTGILDPDVPKDRIHFLAGSIWVLGKSADSSIMSPGHIDPFVKRIDVESNQVTATVPLKNNPGIAANTPTHISCPQYREPQAPVALNDGIWISMHCGKAQSALLKIDLRTNQIVGEFGFAAPGEFEPAGFLRGTGFISIRPALVVTGNALWGIDGDAAIRIDF